MNHIINDANAFTLSISQKCQNNYNDIIDANIEHYSTNDFFNAILQALHQDELLEVEANAKAFAAFITKHHDPKTELVLDLEFSVICRDASTFIFLARTSFLPDEILVSETHRVFEQMKSWGMIPTNATLEV